MLRHVYVYICMIFCHLFVNHHMQCKEKTQTTNKDQDSGSSVLELAKSAAVSSTRHLWLPWGLAVKSRIHAVSEQWASRWPKNPTAAGDFFGDFQPFSWWIFLKVKWDQSSSILGSWPCAVVMNLDLPKLKLAPQNHGVFLGSFLPIRASLLQKNCCCRLHWEATLQQCKLHKNIASSSPHHKEPAKVIERSANSRDLKQRSCFQLSCTCFQNCFARWTGLHFARTRFQQWNVVGPAQNSTLTGLRTHHLNISLYFTVLHPGFHVR